MKEPAVRSDVAQNHEVPKSILRSDAVTPSNSICFAHQIAGASRWRIRRRASFCRKSRLAEMTVSAASSADSTAALDAFTAVRISQAEAASPIRMRPVAKESPVGCDQR